ncbi:MAG: hypothetical protein ACLUSP_03390 [Christensenellales bacterium]
MHGQYLPQRYGGVYFAPNAQKLGRDDVVAESYGLKVRKGDGIHPLAVAALRSLGIVAKVTPRACLPEKSPTGPRLSSV